ncbi:hypothetical protein N9H45_02540 [Opitutales bacterium]|nr:hypothetical protein [Opitutales bacterium]
MYSLRQILILLFGVVISLQAVPPVLNYAGQVAVNGEAFDGNGLFKFALVNADGTTTYWSNDGTSVDGSEPQASVTVSVNGGLYAILLGNTAQQGMGEIDPSVFAQHNGAKLRVWFSDGVNGFQQLSPDRPFASVPYAFSAGTAQTADSVNVATTAMAVQAGAVTSRMLASNAVTSDKLSPQIKADINATIGMNRLSTEVTEKLNQEKTTNNYNAPSVGSLLAVPSGSDAPTGYSLYQRGEPMELIWEDEAHGSVARYAADGVEKINGKIYFIGGHKWPTQSDNSNKSFDTLEVYDPALDSWTLLNSMNLERKGAAFTVLENKIYAIGGSSYKSVEIYDPSTDEWIFGDDIPFALNWSTAITKDGKIYVVGGRNASNLNTAKVLCFNSLTNGWSEISSLPTARHMVKLVLFKERIWALGGSDGTNNKKVYSLDTSNNSWREEAPLTSDRHWANAWVANDRIYVGGGSHKTLEIYDSLSGLWVFGGAFSENYIGSDSVVVNDRVYVIGGLVDGEVSSKVFSAKLDSSKFLDLYRKDGDAPVGTPVVQSEYADGSVTASKMAEGAVSKSALDATILKYLKPEITSQPQAQTVYEDSNVSYSVTAEGKYLTYQWKKDGVDLTGETNATLNIIDANATLHDGNYSVVVSNDFGSVESWQNEILINDIGPIEGLVGWWKFDETSGIVAYDSSGNGHDGNLTNGPTWTDGKIGGALSFDGVDDHIIAHNFLGIGGSNPRSISAWIKSTSNDPAAICAYGTYAESQKWTFRVHSLEGVYGAIRTENNGGNIVGSTPLNEGSWFFVTSILEPNQSNISNVLHYINGNLDSASIFTSKTINTVLSSNFVIGRRHLQYSADDDIMHFNGLIDDVRIYDRALSAEEVQALYNLGQ